ncbi:MAG TPA: hypothetical protein VFE67_17545, partial [Rudaea sp.]|nr:hypothetical protein [Rudaea sp.]
MKGGAQPRQTTAWLGDGHKKSRGFPRLSSIQIRLAESVSQTCLLHDLAGEIFLLLLDAFAD